MGILSNLEPKRVFEIFEEISAVPRRSGNRDGINKYCMDFAEKLGLEHYSDAAKNVIIYKPATPGYENADTVAIQGHMDMVCVKEPGLDFDFTKDGINLQLDGDTLSARGTTLGADNGVAVAIALAILESKDIPHPSLEIMLTTDEEIGLVGAKELEIEKSKAKKLINLDSGGAGHVTVSCAGGMRVNSEFNYKRKKAEGTVLSITIGGLIGGHSGGEIDKGRGSSNHLMGRVLFAASKAGEIKLLDITGGTAENVIASNTVAKILAEDGDKVAKAVNEIGEILKKEYAEADPGLFVKCENCGKSAENALTDSDTIKIIKALVMMPQGIQAMSMEIKGLVQTSLNMGTITMTEDQCTIIHSIRSSVTSQKEAVYDVLETIVTTLGGRAYHYNDYPAWEYKKQSDFRDLMAVIYKELFNKELVFRAVHGGLECGAFYGKRPDIDYVSTGADIKGAHMVGESVSIESIKNLWIFVCEILKRMK